MARRSSGMPRPGGYWLPRPLRIASAAAWAISAGPSTSGNPWPRLTAGQLIGCQRPQHIELVAIGVGHHDPADVPLPDIDPAGAECFQPGDLGRLVGGPKVQMQPVLADLVLTDFQEQQVGSDTIFRASGGRLQDHLVFLVGRTAPAERGLPERSDLGWVAGV